MGNAYFDQDNYHDLSNMSEERRCCNTDLPKISFYGHFVSSITVLDLPATSEANAVHTNEMTKPACAQNNFLAYDIYAKSPRHRYGIEHRYEQRCEIKLLPYIIWIKLVM